MNHKYVLTVDMNNMANVIEPHIVLTVKGGIVLILNSVRGTNMRRKY